MKSTSPHRAWILVAVAALALAAVPAAVAAPEWTGPGFHYVSDQTQDGVTEINVTYPSNGTSASGVLFLTSATGKHAGIVFAHDGEHRVDAVLREKCRELARMGYIVIAPDYLAQPGSLGKTVADDSQVQQVVDAARLLAKHPNVVASRIGIVGSSRGGYVAMLAASKDPSAFTCLVAANSAIDVAKVAPNLKVPTLLQHGDKDRTVLMKHARHLNHEIQTHGGSSQLKEYTLLAHGFWFYEEGDGHKTEELAQAQWAWEDFTEYLDKRLSRGLPGMAAR